MFGPTGRNSTPFSLMDMDMWDTKSHFTAQSSAWCGMAAVSGSGFLSQVNTSTSGKTSGFRQSDPGLRRWQSMSHLPPRVPSRSFSPSPGAELRAARADSSFRQTEMVQWLQDAQDRLDTHMDLLRPTDVQLRYNKNTAKILDMKQRQLVEARTVVEQEKASELFQSEKSRQGGELHEKVLQLEKELLQMRSALDKGRDVGKSSGSLTRTLQIEQEDFTKQEKQTVDAELCKLREALGEAQAQAKTQEEERNQALQELQTSTETQRTLVNQTEEMSQRLTNAAQNQSELQEQLREANNKISQACLEKAMLSTQVMKFEDEIRELKTKLSEAQSERNHMMEVKADLQQKAQLQLGRTDQSSQVNDQLTGELEKIKQSLEKSQSELQERTAETVKKSDQITALEAERSQLIQEKEELLSKIPADGHKELSDITEKYNLLKKSSESVEVENHKLQDRCLLLEAEVFEKEEKLQQQEEKYQEKDAGRVRSIEELQAVALHWTEKWQRVALTLQSTQAELEELKKRNSKHEIQREDVHKAAEIEKLKKEAQKDKEEIEKLLQYKANMETLPNRDKRESDSLLRLELDACKQELELEKSRSHALFHRNKGIQSVLTQDKETVTDFSTLAPTAGSPLFQETPLDSHSSHSKSLQVTRSSQDDDDQTDSQTSESLKAQLEESKRITNQLQQEKILAIHRLQILKQLYSVKDEGPSMEGRKDKPVAPHNSDTDHQRRMVTEQLKSLFKEREVNETANDGSGSASQTDWAQTPKGTKAALDRRSWHQGSGLMPVFEEDEEEDDQAEDEERTCAEKALAEENIHRQNQQAFNTSTSSMSVEINKPMPKNENLLPDSATLNIKQSTQDPLAAVEDTSSDVVTSSLSNCLELQSDLQKGPPLFYPDGIFRAEFVDICSPDEDEEQDK